MKPWPRERAIMLTDWPWTNSATAVANCTWRRHSAKPMPRLFWNKRAKVRTLAPAVSACCSKGISRDGAAMMAWQAFIRRRSAPTGMGMRIGERRARCNSSRAKPTTTS